MATFRQVPLTCSGHTRPVVDLCFSSLLSDGSYYVISACKDGKPMLRQGDTGDWVGTFVGHKGAVWGVALSADARKAATGSADFSAKLWDAVCGTEVCTLKHAHIVRSVALDLEASRLLTGSNDKIIRLFDLNEGQQSNDNPAITITGHTNKIRRAVLLPNNTMISASEDKTIRLWDMRNVSVELKKVEVDAIPNNLELNGSKVIVCGGSCVSLWNTDTLECEREYTVEPGVQGASLHPQGDCFVCGGIDFKIYKYSVATGKELESSKGHFGPIHCCCFSPDGELYASGSEDGTLRLWQTNLGKDYGLWKCIDAQTNGSTTFQGGPDTVSAEA